MAGFAIAGGLAATFPLSWLVMVPSLLPVIGLAPWNGWITFEEFDLLILAVATGGYGRLAWDASASTRHEKNRVTASPVLAGIVAVLFATSVLIALVRGFNDAGGFHFSWLQGYHEPMNSVRLAKSFFLASLLLPVWCQTQSRYPLHAAPVLSLGLSVGLVGASLAAIWERLAFTGLLNFSADYRTTAMFWEMHVGGAALDGFLSLTMPFAIRELLVAKSTVRWCLSAIALALGGYACLTTFSRGVYLAVPASLAVFACLYMLQQKEIAPNGNLQDESTGHHFGLRAGALLVVSFGGLAGWIFQTSGYRGSGALLGVVVLVLPISRLLRLMTISQWLVGVVAGLLLTAIAASIAWLVPEGPYIAYVLGLAFTGLMCGHFLKKPAAYSAAGPMAFAGFLCTAVTIVMVAKDWGNSPAVVPAFAGGVACLSLACTAGMVRRPIWPETIRWQAGIAFVMAAAIVVIGIFGGGAYMGERFSTGNGDMEARLKHWKLGADMLHSSADWWLGKGEGRFPANYFLIGDPREHPGDYRLIHEGEKYHLRLTGGLQEMNGWGEIFRVTQRISQPEGPLKVNVMVRTAMNIGLHFEVCEKHLLYNENCLLGKAVVKPLYGQWQMIEIALAGQDVFRGNWYAPKLLAFSVAMETRGGTAELDQFRLFGSDGRNLLANGDFSNGMAHWFSSSDRNHLPWHIKNMFMHVLFDQGIVGLSFWLLMVGSAMIRLTIGKSRHHLLAPPLAASLTGFAVVGMFDSLLDVPRVATLFYFLTLTSLVLPSRPPATK